MKILLQTIFLSMLLVGCSSDKEADGVAEQENYKTAEQIYTEARDLFSAKNYKKAAESFDEVERLHPYSDWSQRSQIMAGFSHYKAQKYDDAILTLERYVKLHPGGDSVDYAYYLIGLSYYEQISDVGRDQGITKQARKALTDVVRRFPNTEYARDAKLKLDLTIDHLAGKEMMIGRYYQGRQEYLAAANRFRTVVEQYDTTTHTPEALHRLVETYLQLGVREQAERYGAVLGHNFPESKWYQRSYALLKEGKDGSVASSGWSLF